MSMTHKEALRVAMERLRDFPSMSCFASRTERDEAKLEALIRDYIEARGRVLVPKEATEEMVMTQGKSRPDLARTCAQRELAETLNDSVRSMAVAVWSEMLAAAPDPFKDDAP